MSFFDLQIRRKLLGRAFPQKFIERGFEFRQLREPLRGRFQFLLLEDESFAISALYANAKFAIHQKRSRRQNAQATLFDGRKNRRAFAASQAQRTLVRRNRDWTKSSLKQPL